jgi:2-polyprenyl-3-methyl-5-hydroxy-6-metoxy-1,4-benzoquinol methylase
MTSLDRRTYDERYYQEMVAEARELPPKLAEKLAYWFAFSGQELRAGADALDAGCGAGTLAKFLTLRGQRVVGVDAFAVPVTLATGIVPEARFLVADLNEPLPFADESFDLVLSYEVIEHLTRPEVFAKEALRVLRPGGAVVLKTPNRLDFYRMADPLLGRTWYADEDHTHVRYFGQFGLARLLRRAGFVDVSVRAGTKPFLRKWRRWRKWFDPRLPVFGNGVAGRAVKPAAPDRG